MLNKAKPNPTIYNKQSSLNVHHLTIQTMLLQKNLLELIIVIYSKKKI